VSELTEVAEEDIPACANVNDGCGATTAGDCAGGEYWNGDECTKCAEYTYTETGVYASASGDSDDSGCKPCGADEDLQTWVTGFFDDPPLFDGAYYGAWTNQDEIIASMLLYSPAGSEGADSCLANCNYGTFWDGSECAPCDVNTYLGFDDYEYSATVMATYNENRASPKYGDGAGNADLCIPCPTLTIVDISGNTDLAGDTGGDEGLAQCQWSYCGV
jgi:hypothetical protein